MPAVGEIRVILEAMRHLVPLMTDNEIVAIRLIINSVIERLGREGDHD